MSSLDDVNVSTLMAHEGIDCITLIRLLKKKGCHVLFNVEVKPNRNPVNITVTEKYISSLPLTVLNKLIN